MTIFQNAKLFTKLWKSPLLKPNCRRLFCEVIDEGFDLFIAAGGDGTVSYIGNFLIGKDKPLGILPLGLAISSPKSFHSPKTPDALGQTYFRQSQDDPDGYNQVQRSPFYCQYQQALHRKLWKTPMLKIKTFRVLCLRYQFCQTALDWNSRSFSCP